MRVPDTIVAAPREISPIARSHGTVAIQRWSIGTYLQGLTLTRVGLVLLICAILSARQLSWCYHSACGLPDALTLGGSARFIARHFVLALPMLFMVTLADNLTLRSREAVRILALSSAVLLGAAVYGLAFLHTQPPNVLRVAEGRHMVFFASYFSRALLYGGLATAVLYYLARERDDARALHETKLGKLTLDRQIVEARLQALQAQIEPHFLFNTLANIRLLYETESSRAKLLIHDFASYLRAALPQMRDGASTLSREIALAQAYLNILKVRMGERLKVQSDVPADLRDARMPPMMLLTLVENAIKHGLSPLPRGGTIAIHAERLADRLRVAVTDDGVGFPKGYGSGVGLANTRARLAVMYGDAGRLTLEASPGGGVTAGIEVPYETSSVAGTA